MSYINFCEGFLLYIIFYKNSLRTSKAGMNSCILMLASVIHIKCQQMSHAVWFGILSRSNKTGQQRHLHAVQVFDLLTCWVYKCKNKILLAHCGLLVLFSWCVVIVSFLVSVSFVFYISYMEMSINGACFRSINGACFSTWCNIVIKNTILILLAYWCSY